MIGIICVVIASLLWSLNPAVIQRYRYVVRPTLFTGLRGLFAFLGLLPIVLIFSHNMFSSMSVKAILFIIASAVLGPGIGDTAYAISIKLVGGSLAVVISYTYIFVAQLLAVVFLGERFTWFIAIGSALAFIGIVLALYRNTDSSTSKSSIAIGILYAAISSITWGIASFMIKPIYNEIPDPLTISLTRIGIVAILFISIGLRETESFSEIRGQIAPAAITGVLGWSLGMSLYVYAIGVAGVTISVTATALTPIASQITIALINKTKISWRYIAGSILVATGIILLAINT